MNVIKYYYIFSLFFMIFSYFFIDQNLSYLSFLYTGISTDYRVVSVISYSSLIIIWYLVYVRLLFLLIHKKELWRDVRKTIIYSSIFLVLSYPAVLSYDIFNYLLTAKVLFLYRENPYIVLPIEFSGEPFLVFTRAANKIALYGPTWIVFSMLPNFFGFGNFLLTVLSFKIFNAFIYFGVLWTIWKISKNIVSVALFALNPLILIEVLAGSHNDILMVLLVLLTFLLFQRKKILLGIMFFLLSIGVKYATIVLLPLVAYCFWKTIRKEDIQWNKVFLFSALAMFLAFLSAPFREEIYPWYASWFISLSSLITERRILNSILISLSFGLMLSYTPYMLSGSYLGDTALLKSIIIIIPVSFLGMYFFINKLWQKKMNSSL